MTGDVGRVVFPCGWVHDPETDLLRMYYGGADTTIGLATAKLAEVLDLLRRAPRPRDQRPPEPRRVLETV
jgi:predicted GH43/DUF377 family glycosyl hydrolase